jgi:hypothetical protein
MDYGLYIVLGLFAGSMVISSYIFNRMMKEE